MAIGDGPWVGYGEATGGALPPEGQFSSSVGGRVTTSSYSPQQRAAYNWLQAQGGTNELNYNQSLAAINAQRRAIGGAYGAAASQANRDAGLAIRAANEDLWYGTQLRNEGQYRDVDLGRSRSYTDSWNATQLWNFLRQNLTERRGFAERGYGLANQQTNLQYGGQMRETGSDAISRGARTAAGTIAKFGDIRQGRDIGLAGNRLELERESSSIDDAWRRGDQANWLAQTHHGINLQEFDSIARTYGIQAAQAAAQAALARDRAESARAGSIGAASASRNAALAGLSGQRASAESNYLGQQTALMQQLLQFA